MDWRKHFVGQARYASINWEVTGFCSCGSGTIPDVSGRFLIYGFRFGLIIVMSFDPNGLSNRQQCEARPYAPPHTNIWRCDLGDSVFDLALSHRRSKQ
jgi:hypothetical protein